MIMLLFCRRMSLFGIENVNIETEDQSHSHKAKKVNEK